MRKFICLVGAMSDIFTDRSRERVSEERLISCCHDLTRLVKCTYQPDIVIALGTGGSLPGELIAQELGIPIEHVVIRRQITMRRYSSDPAPLRLLMSLYHHFIFRSTTPVVSTYIDTEIFGKKILLVDDVVHTGATLDVSIKHLQEMSPSDIKVASLSYVSKRRPDFFVLPRGNYCFPWSGDFTNP